MVAYPEGAYRLKEGLGLWEYRGKVAAVGVGHSPIDRRWEETLETSLGAYAIIAAKNCMEDAGVTANDIDGVVSAPGPLGERWAPRPYFDPPYNSEDGLSMVTAEWLTKNMGLKNAKFLESRTPRISEALCVAAEAIGSGRCSTCLVLRPLGNLAGRYGQAGRMAQPEAPGAAAWTMTYGWSGPAADAIAFERYCYKYGHTHDKMAPFMVNNRRNGLMNPNSYYYQHRPEPLTVEEYLAGRWISKPANIYDCDLPVQAAGCFLLTTAERAKNKKQKPAYVLSHYTNRFQPRGAHETLEEMEYAASSAAHKLYEGSGLTAADVDIFNLYDGFTVFTPFWLDGFSCFGAKRGDALDIFNGGVEVEGRHPFNTSGGNNGCGRIHGVPHFADAIHQIQGRSGKRQVQKPGGINVTVSNCTRQLACAGVMFASSPD